MIFASFPARNYGNLGALKWLEVTLPSHGFRKFSPELSGKLRGPFRKDRDIREPGNLARLAGLSDRSVPVRNQLPFQRHARSREADRKVHRAHRAILKQVTPRTNRSNTKVRNFRSAIPSGYTDTTPFAYYAGIPVVDLNFAAFCGGDLKITENKTIIGNCAQIALSLILEFAGKPSPLFPQT